MKKQVLIAAGGAGIRMQASVPKQFTMLAGKPLLMHTIQAFLSYDPGIHIVVVLPETLIVPWQQLCRQYRFPASHEVVAGGPTRFHSVKNGLKRIPDDSLVAVHDGARPLVSLDTISRVFHFAAKFGNAIPVVVSRDSVRLAEGAVSSPLNRSSIRLVQTPQCFRGGRLKKSFDRNYHESFTDEATVFEADGERLFLVDGNLENIKITHPSDLIIAEALLAKRPS